MRRSLRRAMKRSGGPKLPAVRFATAPWKQGYNVASIMGGLSVPSFHADEVRRGDFEELNTSVTELFMPPRSVITGSDFLVHAEPTAVNSWIEALDRLGFGEAINRSHNRESVVEAAGKVLQNLFGGHCAFIDDEIVSPEHIETNGPHDAWWIDVGPFYRTKLWPVIVGLCVRAEKELLFDVSFPDEVDYCEEYGNDNLLYAVDEYEKVKDNKGEELFLERKFELEAAQAFLHEDWMQPWFHKMCSDFAWRSGANKFDDQLNKNVQRILKKHPVQRNLMEYLLEQIKQHSEKYSSREASNYSMYHLNSYGYEGDHDSAINCIAWGVNDDLLYEQMNARCQSSKNELEVFSYVKRVYVRDKNIYENSSDREAAIDRTKLRKLTWECVNSLLDLLTDKTFGKRWTGQPFSREQQ